MYRSGSVESSRSKGAASRVTPHARELLRLDPGNEVPHQQESILVVDRRKCQVPDDLGLTRRRDFTIAREQDSTSRGEAL
jgi:hypothetical protein